MTEEKKLNYFEELNQINVSDNVEKKNGLSYLSWAWAWTELKKRYPNAKKSVIKNSEGWLYHTDGKTCWVEVSVTINDIEEVEYLPVMDYKNQSIALAAIKSTNVNTSIQRALTKAIARHGLGLYIYAGEDLPEVEESDIKRLGNIAEAETKEVFDKKNQDQFNGLKSIIESCGGIEELQEVWTDKQNVSIIKSLEKRDTKLHELLIQAKDAMKESFGE
jgi:hypothetical protein